MPWIPVQSSSVRRVVFEPSEVDPQKGVMLVEFVGSGGTYAYSITKPAFDAFLAAPSKGNAMRQIAKMNKGRRVR